MARDLDPVLERSLGKLGRARGVPVVRVHPELAPSGLDDRSGQPVVVGVRVRADEQADVGERESRPVECALELSQRSGLVEAGVDEHYTATRGDGEGVDVRNTRPRQGKAQAPEAGEHPIGASELALAGTGRRRAHRRECSHGLEVTAGPELHTGAAISWAEMGRRQRRRGRESETTVVAATTDYRDAEGNVLTLRDELSAGTVAQLRRGESRAAASLDDIEARRFELLFERLAVRWEIAGLPLESQRELLGRLRMADPELRRWVRATLTEHARRTVPELEL
jgi:hypothetical protein